jgi:anti-sigma-K factor RskA
MMAYSEDQIALAAEYALGTLDSEERAEVETIMARDEEFTEVVRSWQHRLGALNQMVGSVEPPPEVWSRIRAEIGPAEQASLVLPDPEPPQIPPAVAPVVKPASDGDSAVQSLAAERRWRHVAIVAGTIATVLFAMLVVVVYRPGLLPNRPLPKPAMEAAEEVKHEPGPASTSAPLALPSAQSAAILQGENGVPAFILTVDGATRNFTVRRLGADAEPGKSFQLWLISEKLPQPRSLGVLGESEFTSRPVLASYDNEVVNTATYGVTLEQAGGSPDGNPHLPLLFTGKLIETVPPAPISPRG